MLKIPARFKQCDLSVSLAFDYCDCIVNMGTRAAACKQYFPSSLPHSKNIFIFPIFKKTPHTYANHLKNENVRAFK